MKKIFTFIVVVSTAILFFSSCGSRKDRCPKVHEANYEIPK